MTGSERVFENKLLYCKSPVYLVLKKILSTWNWKQEMSFKVATRTRAGQPLRGDPKSEPFRRIGCRRESCLVCSSGKPGQCERNSSGYRIICTPCLESGKKAIYKGETGRNCYSRGLEHQDNLKKELDGSPLWKHCSLEHGGEKVHFTMKALRSYRSCLMRQVKKHCQVEVQEKYFWTSFSNNKKIT